MRTEKVLWTSAFLCAMYLLTGPLLGGRTVWANGGIVTDAAGWDWVMPAAGLVAIGGLVAGVLARPRVAVPVLGAALATAAFAVAAYAAGSYWIAILQGDIQLTGSKAWKGRAVPGDLPGPAAVVRGRRRRGHRFCARPGRELAQAG